MRLIDADKLIETINKEVDMHYMYSPKGFINVVNNQPTAYDVDKVVEQLEKLRDKANLDTLKNMNEPIPYSSASNRVYAYDTAIEIVRNGGDL